MAFSALYHRYSCDTFQLKLRREEVNITHILRVQEAIHLPKRPTMSSFHDMNRWLLRIICTIHNWMRASGYTVFMASGKPFRPSPQAMRISFRPRFFSSVSTLSQNFALSFSASQIPGCSFWPSILMLNAKNTDLLMTRLSCRTCFSFTVFMNPSLMSGDAGWHKAILQKAATYFVKRFRIKVMCPGGWC